MDQPTNQIFNQPDTKYGRKVTIIVVTIFVIVVAGIGVYIWQKYISKQVKINPEQSGVQQNQFAPAQQSTVAPFLILLSPKGGENLCIGDKYDISWEGSKELSVIEVNIVKGAVGDSISYPIGSFPISFNEEGKDNGEGNYSWTIGDTGGGVKLQEDYTYKMVIRGCYPIDKTHCNVMSDLNSKPFSLLNCKG